MGVKYPFRITSQHGGVVSVGHLGLLGVPRAPGLGSNRGTRTKSRPPEAFHLVLHYHRFTSTGLTMMCM